MLDAPYIRMMFSPKRNSSGVSWFVFAAGIRMRIRRGRIRFILVDLSMFKNL